MNSLTACLRFHPVGQGLFTSGSIHIPNGATFNWVFDCGAVKSSDRFLTPETTRYAAGLGSRNLDMLVISHFDQDHIKGIPGILNGRTVRLIVLPYMPLWFRLLLIIRLGATGSFRRFLIDPVAYLQSLTEVGKIVFITGGGELGPEQDFGEPSQPDNDSPPDFSLNVPPGSTPEADDLPSSGEGLLANVSIVSHSSPFRIGAFWEFMFYNETAPSKVSIPQLQRDVTRCLNNHRIALGRFTWAALLPDLHAIYDAHFGAGAGPRNDISLAMYSGPIASTNGDPLVCLHPSGTWVAIKLWPPSLIPAVPIHVSTGDGSYDSVAKINALVAHFTSARWDRVSVFQVPHHGSVHSWVAPGGSALCRHRFSIFSARTSSKHHPHPCVWADFMGRQPILVSERTGLVAWGRL